LPLSQVVCRYREDREGTDGTRNHEGEDLAQWRATIVYFPGLPKDGIDQWSDPSFKGQGCVANIRQQCHK